MKQYKRYRRRVVNLLLQPFVQLRVGLANVTISLIFVCLLGGYAYTKLVHFADVVVTLTQADKEIFQLLSGYLSNVAWTTVIGAVVFILVTLFLDVWLTHKMVGPTVAFRRHIKELMEGNFQAKTSLRRGDAFTEVADDLNLLSEKLQQYVRKTK